MNGGPQATPADPGGLLREALQVHRRWLEDGGVPAPGDLLARYPHLRDFLEPLVLEQTQETPAEGRLLGDFRLLREIGRGGMGVVYEARQLSLDRPVALKVLSAALALQPRAVARFRREALTAAGLDHPNLVRVLAAGTEGDTCFFAMEFVEGAPLDRVLEQAAQAGLEILDGAWIGALAAVERHRTAGATGVDLRAGSAPFWRRSHVATAVGLALQVARGLEHAHRAGVLHRDVKPSNILVRPDGTALLTDFGLAREAGLPGMTLTGDFVGTPYYASPEQARGKGVDRRSDLFSLGATLYELLTLERPFPGETSHAVLEGILRREPLDPRRRNPKVPADLAAIVLKAMEKEPARRYQTAGALARDLQAFLEGRPVSARRPSAPARALRWARREPIQAALLLVLALGLPLLAGLGGYILARRGAIELGRRVAREQELEDLLAEAFFLQVRRETDSRPLFERVLAQDPGNVAALMGIAQELCWRKEYAGLREHLDRHASSLQGIETAERMGAALQDRPGPSSPASHPATEREADTERLALNLYLQGMDLYGEEVHRGGASRWSEAAERIEEAIRLSPRPRALFYCGLADIAFQGRLEAQARRAARALALLWPGSMRARFYQSVALCRVDPVRALELAVALRRDGYPQDHVFRDLLALCHLEAGAIDPAMEIFAEDLAAHPEDAVVQAQIHLNRGAAWARAGEREKAIACYRQALLCNPDYALAHANLGKQLLALRRFAESRAHLERAHALAPDYGSPLESLALLCRAEKRHAEGAEWAGRLLVLDPGDAEKRFLLADLLRRAGRGKEAEAEYRRLLAIDTGQARVLDALGLLEQTRPEEALYWFRRAVEADPEYFQGRLNLATTLARVGRHPEALPHLEQAVRLDPGHRIALQNLARLYGDLGREELARPDREAALAPVQDPLLFLALAEARLRVGCPAGCRELLDRADRLVAGVPEARRGELEARARALRERL